MRSFFENMDWLSFLKYVISGAGSVIIQFCLLYVSVEYLKLPETFSSAISYVFASIALYLMLYFWAFKSNGKHLHVAFRYTIVTIIGFGFNTVFFWVLTIPLGLWYFYSQIIASTFVALSNYVVNRLYTFV